MNDIADPDTLRAHMGPISPLAERKVLPRLDHHCRHFISLSPMLVIATSGGDGKLDASPRGDPPGFVRVLDDTTLLLPDRPGNNRVDTFENLLSCAGVGLIFFVPGITETLRVNGRASLLTDPAALAPSAVNGKTPQTGLLVAIEEVFFHCGKALKRAQFWNPDAQVDRTTFPSLGRILADQIAGIDAEAAQTRVEAAYRDKLY